MKYSVEGTRGALYVSQPDPEEVPNFGKTRNSWTVKIAPDVPTDLSLKLGVGASDVDLRGVDVTALEALTGVGEAKIDLSGERDARPDGEGRGRRGRGHHLGPDRRGRADRGKRRRPRRVLGAWLLERGGWLEPGTEAAS